MGSTATQEKRILKSSLGDELLLIKVEAQETMSALFSYKLRYISSQQGLKAQDYIGKNVTITIEDDEVKSPQYFNGIINTFASHAFMLKDYYVYEVTLVPWLWFLSKRSNCQVFQNKDLKTILTDIFSAAGYRDFSFKLQGELSTIPYCTQYRETDLHFVSRLLQHYGIFYYFEHAEGKHTAVFANHKDAYMPAQASELVHKDAGRACYSVLSWVNTSSFPSGEWVCNSHNYRDSKQTLTATKSSSLPLKNLSKFQRYDELSSYEETSAGENFSQLRIDAETAAYNVTSATSNYRSLHVGQIIQLNQKDFQGATEFKYVIFSLKFTAHEYSYLPGLEQEKKSVYKNQFQCIPSTTVMRPKVTLTKPTAPGLQEAIITGASGEDIYVNAMGCHKVKFYWDRTGEANENSSCWVRAVQHWEGTFRVGTPVLIDFMQSDIDRPIIIGPVYDDVVSPLYTLSANKTRSAIKRRWPNKESQAPYQKYNEIYFEDKSDEEQMGLAAGRDMLVVVQNDRNTQIKNNDTTTITKQRLVTIEDENDTLQIKKGDLNILVDQGKITIKAKSDIDINATGNILMNAQQDIQIKAAGNLTLESGQGISAKSSTSIEADAGTSFTQKAGTTMEISSGAQCNVKSSMVEVNGSGTVKVDGGIVQLN